jgi:hypothetical protein
MHSVLGRDYETRSLVLTEEAALKGLGHEIDSNISTRMYNSESEISKVLRLKHMGEILCIGVRGRITCTRYEVC